MIMGRGLGQFMMLPSIMWEGEVTIIDLPVAPLNSLRQLQEVAIELDHSYILFNKHLDPIPRQLQHLIRIHFVKVNTQIHQLLPKMKTNSDASFAQLQTSQIEHPH